MGDPAVQVNDLRMRYGRGTTVVTAVDGVDLTVDRGTIAAVLGPNGAGKTTTIETCEGYRRIQAGTVRVLGLDPRADRRRLAPRIGVMLQSGGAWSGVRTEEMLQHVATLHAHPLDVDWLLDRLGLRGCARTPHRRLSSGEKQRLSLAMAVVGRPELVFLDEPTAGLDPQARHLTWSLVQELRRDGVTVVLSTHFMDEAERLADRVHVLDHGQVIASGTPEELTARGAENSIRFSGPPQLPIDTLREALPDDSAVAETAPGYYRVTGAVTPELLATVTAWCSSHGVLPEGLAVERHSLEDVFLDLTGRELRP